jgi:hypothetical protein
MPSNKAKKALKEVKSKHKQWTYEVSGNFNPGGDSNYSGKLKDQNGRVIICIKEDSDFNQLSRLLVTSKYMRNEMDMKGLAEWVWDRNLLPMDSDERKEWRKKKVVPLDIKYVRE